MKDVIVVGGGIIGTTVGKYFTDEGLNVLIIDNNNPMAGTRPSGGHLRPSWFGDMEKDQYEPAMELIDKVWGMNEEEFIEYPKEKPIKIYRVDTDVVMAYDRTLGEVIDINCKEKYPVVTYQVQDRKIKEKCKLLVVSAGIWTNSLIEGVPPVVGKQGVSFRVTGKLENRFVVGWAPYKQVVAHQQGENEIWVGDGSTILQKNWKEATTLKCKERCLTYLDMKSPIVTTTLLGVRPYITKKVKAGDPCYLKQLNDRTWVATGSGKSGTISAGWTLWRLINESSL